MLLMSESPLEVRIATFIGKYTPEVATQVRAARARLHALFPRGYEMVYDNYNGLVFGFGPTERASDAVLSIAAYPRWVTLFFLDGVRLYDPRQRLKGSGNRVRSIVLASPDDLDSPSTRELIDQAVRPVATAFENAPPLSTVIKSVSAKQRPRKPGIGLAKPASRGNSRQ
jgi:hypothetical protein